MDEPTPQAATSHEEECAHARQEISRLFSQCGPLIAALGDPTRQAIVSALLDEGERGLRVGQITELTSLSRPAVSHRLRLLGPLADASQMRRSLEWVASMRRQPNCAGVFAAHDPAVPAGTVDF